MQFQFIGINNDGRYPTFRQTLHCVFWPACYTEFGWNRTISSLCESLTLKIITQPCLNSERTCYGSAFSILFQYCPYVWIILDCSNPNLPWFTSITIMVFVKQHFALYFWIFLDISGWDSLVVWLNHRVWSNQRVFSFNLCPGLSRDDQLHPDFGALAQVKLQLLLECFSWLPSGKLT